MSTESDAETGRPSLETVSEAIKRAMGEDLENDTPSAWTSHIIETVRDTVPRDGCFVPYGRLWSSEKQGEYLVDLALAHEEDHEEWSGYRGLVLALECEWGGTKHALWEDFVKLADVRASVKVFVGAAWPQLYSRRQDLLDDWLAFLRRHLHVPDSEQFLVALCEKKTSKTASHCGWILEKQGGVRRLWDE